MWFDFFSMCLCIDEVPCKLLKLNFFMFQVVLYLIIASLVLFILFFLNIFLIELGYNSKDREESSSYECGFEHNSLSRVPLSIRYFLLTVVFLIFDLEIVLLVFSASYYISSNSLLFRLTACLCFVMFLFLGLIYE
jgi:NADH:ubiquinone oxidoreductase subunit 3 (subunit A)